MTPERPQLVIPEKWRTTHKKLSMRGEFDPGLEAGYCVELIEELAAKDAEIVRLTNEGTALAMLVNLRDEELATKKRTYDLNLATMKRNHEISMAEDTRHCEEKLATARRDALEEAAKDNCRYCEKADSHAASHRVGHHFSPAELIDGVGWRHFWYEDGECLDKIRCESSGIWAAKAIRALSAPGEKP